MKKLIIILITVLSFICINPSAGHESETYKHKKIGGCFGWESLGSEMKLCYRNEEHTKCAILIFNHGIFHVTEEFECKKYKEAIMSEEELNLYKMKIHETMRIDNHTKITRVKGGWIYTTESWTDEDCNAGITSCFVPE